jgi:predicted dithiol-disulfide oxidoreductase (DUF899 family)
MSQSDANLQKKIEDLEKELSEKKNELTSLRMKVPHRAVPDYVFRGEAGSETKLSELFGNHEELIIVHNMGRGCPYCTLWGDGFNGVLEHLESRAAFVVVSPDDMETQKKFAESRGWGFKMLSSRGTSFCRDIGFELADKRHLPGVSTYYKDKNGAIFLVAKAEFGPGDDFCAAWHLFDLLPGGSDVWQPKFEY